MAPVETVETVETTPLLVDREGRGRRPAAAEGAQAAKKKPAFSPANRILFAGFLISVALSLTQVPILYAFRIMECDQFYKDHPPFAGNPGDDRCARNEIDSGTAAQISILGMTTTFCGLINLFVAGWQIKRFGPKTGLTLQTITPALRVAIQAAAVAVGARPGILMIQASQLVNVLGGPSGYLLALNTAVGEVSAPARRTAAFGQLQGSVMLGTALGYLQGGYIGDTFGIGRPFQVACALFTATSLYIATVVPRIVPQDAGGGRSTTTNNNNKRGTTSTLETIFGALRVLAPRRLRTAEGTVVRHYGTLFLAMGVFMGVLATGYAPMMILMYAMAAFDFRPEENGYLMSVNSVIRGIFLVFVFPRIIQRGRQWYSSFEGGQSAQSGQSAQTDVLPTHPEDFEPPAGILAEEEPATPPKPATATEGRAFDLAFLRWSLVADGLVTVNTAFATKHWHIYLAGFLLPLASGSAPASKGVITEMCGAGQQTDALQVMTLVENMAMLSTLGLFGYIFSAFSAIGKAYLTFYCNAAVVLVAVAILAFCHFPPDGSEVVEEVEEEEE